MSLGCGVDVVLAVVLGVVFVPKHVTVFGLDLGIVLDPHRGLGVVFGIVRCVCIARGCVRVMFSGRSFVGCYLRFCSWLLWWLI